MASWIEHVEASHRRRNRWGGSRAPPIFYLETLLIFIHAAQIATIAVYITFGPPKMELLPTPMQARVAEANKMVISYSQLFHIPETPVSLFFPHSGIRKRGGNNKETTSLVVLPTSAMHASWSIFF